MVEIRVEDKLEIDFHPVEASEEGICLAKGEAYDKIMQPFYARNQELLNGEWVKGWRAFCESVKERYSSTEARPVPQTAPHPASRHRPVYGRMHWIS